jgi:hypothetical protein
MPIEMPQITLVSLGKPLSRILTGTTFGSIPHVPFITVQDAFLDNLCVCGNNTNIG